VATAVSKTSGQLDLMEQQQADRRKKEQEKREQLQAWGLQQAQRMVCYQNNRSRLSHVLPFVCKRSTLYGSRIGRCF